MVLTGSDGGALAERTLAAGSDCDELAAAAAVVIATWSAELDRLSRRA